MTLANELAERLERASAEVARWSEWERQAVRREIREVSADQSRQAAPYAPSQQAE